MGSMSGTDIAVIVGGLVVGYWLVSVFLPNAIKPSARARQDEFTHTQEKSQEKTTGRPDKARETPPLRWYQVLGVDKNASREQIVAAYKLKIGQYHPDKVSRMGDEIRNLAEMRSKQINAAYEQAMRTSKPA